MHSHLNSKMEILTVFSILNSLFLPKMEILAFFSILNSFFLPKMEILTLFSILISLFLLKMEILTLFSIFSSLFLPKMEILTIFSILNNKKSGKLRITFDSLPRFLFYIYIYRKINLSYSSLNFTPLSFSFLIIPTPIPSSFFSSFSV